MATNRFPMINGINYSWASVIIRLLNVDIKGVSKISYKDDQEIEGQMGAGSAPVSVSYGDEKKNGSIELFKETIEALEDLSPDGRIQSIPPFPIIVQFLRADGSFRNVTLLMCILKSNGLDTKTGDKALKEEIPLFIGDIKFK